MAATEVLDKLAPEKLPKVEHNDDWDVPFWQSAPPKRARAHRYAIREVQQKRECCCLIRSSKRFEVRVVGQFDVAKFPWWDCRELSV